MMPQISGMPLEPGPLSLVLLHTNLKSIVVRQEGGRSKAGTDTVGEIRGGSGRTVNGADRLVGQPGQVQVPA